MEKELIEIIEEIVKRLEDADRGGCEARGYFISNTSSSDDPKVTGISIWLDVDNMDEGDNESYTQTVDELYIFEDHVFLITEGIDTPFINQTEYFQKSILEGMKDALDAVKEDLL